MATYSAGDASLRIVPDAKEFKSLLEADMRKIRAEFRLNVTADTGQARADINRFREVASREGMRLGVDVGLAQAKTDMDAFRERQRRDGMAIKVDIEDGEAKAELAELRARERAQNIRVRVDADTGGALKQLEELGKGVSGIAGAIGGNLKFNGLVAGFAELPAAATAITTVAGSVQQLAQAGLVLPGVMAGIASSVGTAALGFHGLGDAIKDAWKAADSGDPKDLKKATEAMQGLAPAAQDVVHSIIGMQPAFKDLRTTVQSNMFDGFGKSLTDLSHTMLPTFKTGLGGIATAWNGTLKSLTGAVGSNSSKTLLDSIFGNTALAQTKANAAIGPFVHAFEQLAATGTNALPRLATGLGTIGDRFDHFISAAAGDGRLDKWINGGLTGFTKIGDTLLNVGKSFTAITQAAGGGEGFLTMLQQGSQKLSDFLNSTRGQDDLRKFFADGRAELQQLMPLVKDLGPILGSAFDAAKDAAGVFMPLLTQITGWLASSPDTVRNFATAFLVWKNVEGISSLLTSLGTVKTALLGLPVAADTAAAGMSAALARVALPAWLSAFLGNEIANKIDGRNDGLGDTFDKALGAPKRIYQEITGERDPNTGQLRQQPIPGPTPAQSREHQGLPPVDPTGGLLTPGGPQAPAPTATPPTNVLEALVPHYQAGGGTPTARGPLPDGGYHAVVHPKEWVANARGRTVLGDAFLDAANHGIVNPTLLPHFDVGGPGDGRLIDGYGNPVTPGNLPGSGVYQPIGPNPMGNTGVPNALGSFLSSLGGVQQNITSLIPGVGNRTQTVGDDGPKLLPGFAGLAQAGGDPALLDKWGQQTGDWLGKFAGNTLLKLGTTLWQGGLGFFGLQNSILSPSNPWFQDAAKTAGFALGSDGPIGAQLNTSKTSSTKGITGQQLREAQDKLTDRNNALAVAQARLSELPANAKGSERLAAQNAVDKAQREATEAGNDLGQYQQGINPAKTNRIVGGAPSSNKALAQQIFGEYFPASEWSAFDTLEMHEAGYDNKAKNPSSTAFGMGQFLDSTWGPYGAKTSDPATQIRYMLQYIKNTYGTPSNAWAKYYQHPGGIGWYDNGGWLQPGLSMMLNQTGKPEAVLNPAQTQAYQTVAAHIEKQSATTTPAVPQLPDVHHLQPRGAAEIPNAPTTQLPAHISPIPASATPVQPATPQQQDQQQPRVTVGSPNSAAPGPNELNHNLAAINTGIASGASTLGNIAATAASMGMAASGGGAGAGAGLASSMIAGLFQQGGKIATNAVNIGSSLLVGNVPGSFGDSDRAYGHTVRPQQNVPVVAPTSVMNVGGIYGHDTNTVLQELDLRQAQASQARMAKYGG